MDIIKGEKKDIPSIFDIISECTKYMESQEIYQWNEFYPDLDVIQSDVKSGDSYVIKNNGKCIAYVVINEDQPSEYENVNWLTDGRKVLVIHRLSVHPDFQGKGIAKNILKFIEDFAIENNYSSIRLDAYSENKRALKLYENFHYKRVGQFDLSVREFPFYCYEKII